MRDVQAAAKDERALFYTTGRKAELESVGKFTDGLSFMKWSNLRSDGQPAHDAKIADTDIPFFRLAEAYLIRASLFESRRRKCTTKCLVGYQSPQRPCQSNRNTLCQ